MRDSGGTWAQELVNVRWNPLSAFVSRYGHQDTCLMLRSADIPYLRGTDYQEDLKLLL